MKKTILYILILLPFINFAQNDSLQKTITIDFKGYLKYMQTLSFQDIDGNWTTDNLIHNRLQFHSQIGNHLNFDVAMRNRIFYGETVNLLPQYPDFINQKQGFLNLSNIVFKSQSVFMHTAIDRLFLNYSFGKVEITIGRQRINWGQTFAFNPNDLFNSADFFDFDYEEKPGADAIRIQWYPSYTSKFDVVAQIDENKKLTTAALYRFNRWNTDIQFLGGLYKQHDYIVGAGFSGNLFKGGLRGELSYFHPEETWADTNGTIVASLAYDYTFSNSLMIQLEALYNGYGQSSGDFNLSQFYFMQISPQNLALAEWSYLFTASYPITPLMSFQFSSMYSPSNKAFYYGPSISYSLKENLDFSIFSQIFTSETTATNGGKGGFLFWRLKGSF